METDLFLALLDPANPRGHPLLAAWLYAYCPAAARWWLAGADPVEPAAKRTRPAAEAPFDPLWQALTDLAGGSTLKDALNRHGFGTLVDAAREYVAHVDAWRARYAGLPAPERLPTFPGGRLALAQRFGLQAEFTNFGGRWENFFAYVRAWAYLLGDWERALQFATPVELAPVRLALTLLGMRRPVYLSAWSWVAKSGDGRRRVVGLLGRDPAQDQVRSGLVRRAGPVGDQPWPDPPEVWVLDRLSGGAEPAANHLADEALPELVGRLAELAQNGPYLPQAALQGAAECQRCGYQAQCFLKNGALSPLALTI